jgi:hypothetical protein
MKAINNSSTGNEAGSGMINRIKEIITNEPEQVKEESNNSKYLLALLGIMLLTGVSYYF